MVGIKVLRLSRPSLQECPPYTQTGAQPVLPSLDLSLLSTFANVFVGETFSSMFVVANNEADENVLATVSVSIKPPAEDEFQLIHPDLPTSRHLLQPTESVSHNVDYEVKEEGLHVLNATIRCTYPNDKSREPTVLRKHYKFSASPALNVKTKLSELLSRSSKHSSYSIEAQIENISPVAVVLETLELLPAEGWLCQPLGSPPSHPLMPKDVWQYAVILKRDPDIATRPAPIGQGRLTLGWRREPFGERGWLTTGPVKP